VRSGWLVMGAIIALAGCSTVPTSFKPPDPISPAAFSHRVFGEVLSAHVKNGWVDYSGIQIDGRLPTYLAQLDRVDPNAFATRHERLAFWINVYNAFAIKGILDQDSPRTLVGRYRYFIARDYHVGGESVNLYDLERKVIIEQFREPRIHFAIVCASLSCPWLQPWAYEADRLEEQLEVVTRAFINDATKNRFDRRTKVAYLSLIFKWYAEDFEASSGGILKYVGKYVSDPEVARDLESSSYKVEFLDYDWSLNGTAPRKPDHAGAS
jgi:Protein of unknown function, DUF547